MKNVSEGWALELRGEKIDLDDLREELRAPFDPWVEDYLDGEDAVLLLRSHNWKDMKTTGEMMGDARRLIDQINGAHFLGQSDARLISAGATRRFGPDGATLPVVISATINITLGNVRVRGRVSTGAAPNAPVESPLQRRLALANREEAVADLLVFLSRADDWFDLFKAIECVEKLAGGQKKAEGLAAGWNDARRTANVYRHAPSPSRTLPKNPPSVVTVRTLIAEVARGLL